MLRDFLRVVAAVAGVFLAGNLGAHKDAGSQSVSGRSPHPLIRQNCGLVHGCGDLDGFILLDPICGEKAKVTREM